MKYLLALLLSVFSAKAGEVLTVNTNGLLINTNISVTNIHAALKIPINITAIMGDSLSCPGYGRWPEQLTNKSRKISGGLVYDYAVSGSYSGDAVAAYATTTHLVRPTLTNQHGLFVVWIGINNVTFNVWGTNDTSGLIYADLCSLWGAARLDGYEVCASTITGYTNWSAHQWMIRSNLNVLIMSDRTKYDYLSRPDLLLPDQTVAALFFDGLHPTTYASQLIASMIATVVDQPTGYQYSPGTSGVTNGTGWDLVLNPGGGNVYARDQILNPSYASSSLTIARRTVGGDLDAHAYKSADMTIGDTYPFTRLTGKANGDGFGYDATAGQVHRFLNTTNLFLTRAETSTNATGGTAAMRTADGGIRASVLWSDDGPTYGNSVTSLTVKLTGYGGALFDATPAQVASAIGALTIAGTGTANYIPQFTSDGRLTNSLSYYGDAKQLILAAAMYQDVTIMQGTLTNVVFRTTGMMPRDSGYDLGTSGNSWRNIYGTNFYGKLTGNALTATLATSIVNQANSATITATTASATNTIVQRNGAKEIYAYGVRANTLTADAGPLDISATASSIYLFPLNDVVTDGRIIPNGDNLKDLGGVGVRFRDTYSTTFHGTLDGNASTSTLATSIVSQANSATITATPNIVANQIALRSGDGSIAFNTVTCTNLDLYKTCVTTKTSTGIFLPVTVNGGPYFLLLYQ